MSRDSLSLLDQASKVYQTATYSEDHCMSEPKEWDAWVEIVVNEINQSVAYLEKAILVYQRIAEERKGSEQEEGGCHDSEVVR